jgi:RNA polymerase sigma factor (sigma-70 family)
MLMLSLSTRAFANLSLMSDVRFYSHTQRSWDKKMESGKHNSIDQLFVGIRDQAMKFAMRLTGNREDAEDIIQETFLKVSRALDKRDIPENPQAWIYTSIRNTYIDRVRRAKRRIACTSLDETHFDNVVIEPIDLRPTPEEALLSQELAPSLLKAISVLSEVEKMILLDSIESLPLDMHNQLRNGKTPAQRSKMLARVKRKVLQAMQTMAPTTKLGMTT